MPKPTMTQAGAIGRHAIFNLPDGRRIGLAKYGANAGTPVICLHGAPSCRLMFDVAHDAAKRHDLTLICPDRPGYGLSKPDRRPSLASRTQDVLVLINNLGLERFLILGISGGGPYAMALAEKAGDQVRGMALVAPLGQVSKRHLPPQELHAVHRALFQWLPYRRRALVAGAVALAAVFRIAPGLVARGFAAILGSADRTLLAEPENRAALIRMTEGAIIQGVQGAVADLRIFAAGRPQPPAPIEAPTVLWQGTGDRIVPQTAAFALALNIKTCESVRLTGEGHFWIYNHVDEVLARLADFSAKKSTDSPGE
ncbi:MAG: alpha/beta hydrolase [Pseudomonadota bacterium]